jgi:LacI family transcriptional regulator
MTRGSLLASNPRVTVLVPASIGWGRGIIRGVAAYANRHGPWHLHVEPDGERRLPPAGWQGDGVIARVSTPAVAAALRRLRVPVVNVSGIDLGPPTAGIPRVAIDLVASARLAAEHLLERGFRHFAYVGLPRLAYVREHQQAFARTLAAAGHACQVHAPGGSAGSAGRTARLARWLESLPKPVGILAWATSEGRTVLDTCRRAGLLVPEDVAVLCGNDDQLLCETCATPMSAIAAATEQIGEQAAELLDTLMQGRRPRAAAVLVPPAGVVTRQSTDTLAVHEPDLVLAIGYIREHATKGIHVDDILKVVPSSRRRLERLFHDLLGRSPAEEIRRVRIERARHLLATTDLSIPRVAAASGFGTGEYLATVFRQATGTSPLKYRASARTRA